MVELTPIEGQELSVDVLDLQALSTPSALAADELGALGKKYTTHDCDDDDDHNVAVACLLLTTVLSIL
ncbi:MAG: hypothetical protein M3O70_11275 [Actinomycetota bacterium]|nr:hypothetical protein [Actinomycetota bacterium]